MPFPHWLGKAHCGEYFVDVIFGSGNGVAQVDDEWFANAIVDDIFGMPVRLCPAEEMIWSKAFVQERERFDGADVAHLLLARAEQMDWPRLLRRFGAYWRVLLSHLVLFGFIYPSEHQRIPRALMDELLLRLRDEQRSTLPNEKICNGTLISRAQYLPDIEHWGYRDGRLVPRVPSVQMTEEHIADWTDEIEEQDRPT